MDTIMKSEVCVDPTWDPRKMRIAVPVYKVGDPYGIPYIRIQIYFSNKFWIWILRSEYLFKIF